MSNTLQAAPVIHAFRTEQAVRSAAVAHAVRSIATAIRSFFDALFEGIAAYRRFEYLKAWGVSRDKALKLTFGHRADAQ